MRKSTWGLVVDSRGLSCAQVGGLYTRRAAGLAAMWIHNRVFTRLVRAFTHGLSTPLHRFSHLLMGEFSAVSTPPTKATTNLFNFNSCCFN